MPKNSPHHRLTIPASGQRYEAAPDRIGAGMRSPETVIGPPAWDDEFRLSPVHQSEYSLATHSVAEYDDIRFRY